MKKTRIEDVLNGNIKSETEVCIEGWVRTRRDSKAGFSFVNVHDGSCFDPVQVIADGTLANYETDVKKLSAGCAVAISGIVKPSAGKGQSVEIHATDVRGQFRIRRYRYDHIDRQGNKCSPKITVGINGKVFDDRIHGLSPWLF